MARIFFGHSWFYSKYSSTFYETHYESRILENASLLFPSYFCLKFKLDVTSDDYGGPARPDLVLIDRNYRYWYVVEVELEIDSLAAVENQIKIFTSGTYTEKHAEYIYSKDNSLDLDRLKRLIMTQPEVVVLVPRVKPTWANKLSQYGTKFVVIEIFQNDQNSEILRVNGDDLREDEQHLLTSLRYSSRYKRGLEILSPANISVLHPLVNIYFEEELTRWKIVNYGNFYFMIGQGTLPFNIEPGLKMNLYQDLSGNLVMKEARDGRR
jgi:hypothetical protein